jgi:hypothetical protein
LGADFTVIDPKHRAFDRVDVQAYGWGGDPYGTFHLAAKKKKWYDLAVDYRDMAYFSVLPSYADPLLASNGIVLSEQAFDTRRHLTSFSIELLPGNWLVPYFAFERDSNGGTGVTTFVSTGNEYPVPTNLSDATNLYRGGLRIELRRFHATLEQGGTTFSDNQSVYDTPGSTNYGNVSSKIFGQKLDLTSLLGTYGISGSSIYSKALITANPASWIDVYGQFLFSQPKSDVNYQQTDIGNLYLQSQILFYTNEQFLLSAASKMPHTTGSLGAEIRPVRKVRIVESWLTDRLHNAGSANSALTMFGPNVNPFVLQTSVTSALLASSLATNYSQQQTDIIFDATPKLTVRGGYRAVWGDASQAILPVEGLASAAQGTLRRDVGIGGLTFRPNHKVTISADVEAASSSGAYFRTSLYNYQKVRAQARYQATKTLTVTGDFRWLDNQDPQLGINYDYTASQESLTLMWTPWAGKYFDVQGSYSRSDLTSTIGDFQPQALSPQLSEYSERSHTASGLINVKLPHTPTFAPKLVAGGSFFISSGTRPTSYYQPMVKLWLPAGKKLNWFAEWKYYDYGEAQYLYEGFRTQIVTAGVRVTR